MKFKKGEYYKLIIPISWEFDENDEESFNPPSQNRKDHDNWTKEILEYIKTNGKIIKTQLDDSNIISYELPCNVYLEKIKNTTFDTAIESQRFKIYNTDVQIAIIENFLDFEDMLLKVNALEEMILKTK